jgi:hypothetical protein
VAVGACVGGLVNNPTYDSNSKITAQGYTPKFCDSASLRSSIYCCPFGGIIPQGAESDPKPYDTDCPNKTIAVGICTSDPDFSTLPSAPQNVGYSPLAPVDTCVDGHILCQKYVELSEVTGGGSGAPSGYSYKLSGSNGSGLSCYYGDVMTSFCGPVCSGSFTNFSIQCNPLFP